jgi:hypothetical protein
MRKTAPGAQCASNNSEPSLTWPRSGKEVAEMSSGPLFNPEGESFVTNESLRNLMEDVIHRNFEETLHLSDHDVLDYVASVLLRFTSTEEL